MNDRPATQTAETWWELKLRDALMEAGCADEQDGPGEVIAAVKALAARRNELSGELVEAQRLLIGLLLPIAEDVCGDHNLGCDCVPCRSIATVHAYWETVCVVAPQETAP